MTAAANSRTRAAERCDLETLWPAVSEAHLFADLDAFSQWWAEAPWRVRVSDAGNAVLLGRWREHLPYACVLGSWCPGRLVAPLMADAVDVSRAHGLERVVGPLVPEEETGPYDEAGFEILQRIVVCRRTVRAPHGSDMGLSEPPGVHLRPGEPTDEQGVLSLDEKCFDEFWRYDPVTLRALADTESLSVAVRDGRIIGYTLWVCRGSEGTVARLAVDPAIRRRGVGSALLRDAVACLTSAGARAVTLTTQEENGPARRLYVREGFRESPRRLACTISSLPQGAGERAAGKE